MPDTTTAELLSHDNERRFSSVIKKATDDVWQKYVDLCRKKTWGSEIPEFLPTRKDDRLQLYPNIAPSLHVPRSVFKLLPKEQRTSLRQGVSCEGPIPIPLETVHSNLEDPRLKRENYCQREPVDLIVINRERWGKTILYDDGKAPEEKRAHLPVTPLSPHQNTGKAELFKHSCRHTTNMLHRLSLQGGKGVASLRRSKHTQHTPKRQWLKQNKNCKSATKRWHSKGTPYKQGQTGKTGFHKDATMRTPYDTKKKISWFPFSFKKQKQRDNSTNDSVIRNGTTKSENRYRQGNLMPGSFNSNERNNIKAVWSRLFSKKQNEQKFSTKNQQPRSDSERLPTGNSQSSRLSLSHIHSETGSEAPVCRSSMTKDKNKLFIKPMCETGCHRPTEYLTDRVTDQCETFGSGFENLRSPSNENNSCKKRRIMYEIQSPDAERCYRTEVVGLKMKIHVVS